MPSRRHSAAMLSSPRRPSSTMRIFSSAEWCLRVARRISLITCSAAGFCGPVFFSIRRVEVKRLRAFRFVGFRDLSRVSLLLYLAGKGQALLLATVSNNFRYPDGLALLSGIGTLALP